MIQTDDHRRPTIDLTRTFSDCAPEGEEGERDYLRFIRKRNGQPQDWSWLLRSPLAVVLDEAGAGKTVEFRQQVTRLRKADRAAFFVRIERLCQTDLRLSLETAEDVRRLDRWLGTSQPATFLLDSVDEAKLPVERDANPLHAALRRLEAELGPRWADIRLVISSRPSAWHADVELAEIRRLAQRFRQFGAKPDGDAPLERYVKFDPLDSDQVQALADLDDAPPTFVHDLYATGTDEYAGTPLDVTDMVKAYKAALTAGRPGRSAFESLSAIVDRAIERRATETDRTPARSALPGSRTRAGARRLAAACVMGHALSIRLPGSSGDGIDPLAALAGAEPAWSRQEVGQLLATGLFTAAWAGAMRFHHRRTMERLAAEAFAELLEAGLEVEALARTLTPPAFGQWSLPQPFVETIGWLTTLHAGFRDHVLVAAPHVLMEYGDPGLLPSPVRVAALRGHVSRYAEVRWRGEWFPNSRLHRFVQPQLAGLCAELIAARGASEPLGHVLQIIETGAFKACADDVAALAADPDAEIGLRARAVSILGVIGSPAHVRPLLDLGRRLARAPADPDIHARQDRNRFRVACAVVGGDPGGAQARMLGCLIRLEPRDRTYSTGPEDEIVAGLVEPCPPQALPRLVRWLSRLCWAPVERRFGDFSPHSWTALGAHLLPVLEAACARSIETRADLHASPRLIAECDRLIAARDVHGGPLEKYGDAERDRFVQAVNAAPALRRAMFVAAIEAEGGRPVAPSILLRRITRWRRGRAPDATVMADIDWLAGLCADHGNAQVRAEAFDRLRAYLPQMPKADFATTRRDLLRAARARGDRTVISAFTWDPRNSLVRLRWRIERTLSEAPRKWRKLRRWQTRGGPRAAWRGSQVRFHARAIARGEQPDLALWAVNSRTRDSRKLFDDLRAQFGPTVATALRDAAKTYAARHDPGELGGRATRNDHFALIGWNAIALDAPARLEALSPEDARRALAAVLKFDALPDWARTLASRNPEVWRDITAPCIAAELATPDEPDQPMFSQHLSRAGRTAADLRSPLADTALAGLMDNPATAPEDVEAAAALVLADANLHEALRTLAALRCAAALAARDVRVTAPWLRVWLHLDPGTAWAGVRDALTGPWAGQDTLMVELAGQLGGLQLGAEPLEGYVAPAPHLLGEMARDLLRHIRPADDLERNGEIRGRHNAQEFRDGVLRRISTIPTTAARETLEALRDDPLFEPWRHYLARLLDEQVVLAAAPRAWTAQELAQFAGVWTTRPRTAAELSALIARQITAILSELGGTDFDLRELFRHARERELRAYLGKELQARSQGWYGVTQEPVTKNENRRDLRIEARSAQGEVVIVELKVAGGSWTGEELIDHIQSQLADKYLISRRARCGLYVVVALGRKSWPLDDGATVDFDELTRRLHAQAARVAAARRDIEALQVVTHRIELPNPVRSRRKATKPA